MLRRSLNKTGSVPINHASKTKPQALVEEQSV